MAFPIRKKKCKKDKLRQGMLVKCVRRDPWKNYFTGIVEHLYENSVCVRIVSTAEEDDYLVTEKKGRTVVPKRSCLILEDTISG